MLRNPAGTSGPPDGYRKRETALTGICQKKAGHFVEPFSILRGRYASNGVGPLGCVVSAEIKQKNLRTIKCTEPLEAGGWTGSFDF